MNGIILGGYEKNIFSTIRLVYEIMQGFTFVLGIIAINRELNVIVYKFLKDFSCQSRAENEKVFRYCTLVYRNPVCTCVTFDCHNQIQCRLNIVYDDIAAGDNCNMYIFIDDFFNIHGYLQI